MRGLYPIVDLDTLAKRNLAPLVLVEAVLSARPPIIQLRAKRQTPRAVLELLTLLKPLCARAGAQLFANDRPDLALLAGVDGWQRTHNPPPQSAPDPQPPRFLAQIGVLRGFSRSPSGPLVVPRVRATRGTGRSRQPSGNAHA
jgi:hypothetical protein